MYSVCTLYVFFVFFGPFPPKGALGYAVPIVWLARPPLVQFSHLYVLRMYVCDISHVINSKKYVEEAAKKIQALNSPSPSLVISYLRSTI